MQTPIKTVLTLGTSVLITTLAFANEPQVLFTESFDSTPPGRLPPGWVVSAYSDGTRPVTTGQIVAGGKSGSAFLLSAAFQPGGSYWGAVISSPALRNDVALPARSIAFDCWSALGRSITIRVISQDAQYKETGHLEKTFPIPIRQWLPVIVDFVDGKSVGKFNPDAPHLVVTVRIGNDHGYAQTDEVELKVDNFRLLAPAK